MLLRLLRVSSNDSSAARLTNFVGNSSSSRSPEGRRRSRMRSGRRAERECATASAHRGSCVSAQWRSRTCTGSACGGLFLVLFLGGAPRHRPSKTRKRGESSCVEIYADSQTPKHVTLLLAPRNAIRSPVPPSFRIETKADEEEEEGEEIRSNLLVRTRVKLGYANSVVKLPQSETERKRERGRVGRKKKTNEMRETKAVNPGGQRKRERNVCNDETERKRERERERNREKGKERERGEDDGGEKRRGCSGVAGGHTSAPLPRQSARAAWGEFEVGGRTTHSGGGGGVLRRWRRRWRRRGCQGI